MSVDVIVGLQRGDEGKGRFVDLLGKNYDIIARFNGGNNAGHTVVLENGDVLKLHLIPSGIAHKGTLNIIGPGTLVNASKLVEEIDSVKEKNIDVSRDNLKISSGSHLILPIHIYDDEIREAGEGRQGSTKSGIAQVSSFKAMRTGIRTEIIKNDPDQLRKIIFDGLVQQRSSRKKVGLDPVDEKKVADEYVEAALKLSPFITDTVFYLNNRLIEQPETKILAEGAQAFLLDIDHGMYPYTTSTSTTSGGVATGLGIPPFLINKVYGVVKAVQSHVGGGPFVTEVTNEKELAMLHGDLGKVDSEYGTTTGRKRRLGYLDLPQVARANMVNGVKEMIVSKLDWVPRFGDEIPVCVAYERKGKTLLVAPDSARKLEQCTPVYEKLPSWDENIQGVRKFDDLPKNAKNFIKFIEDKAGVKVSLIGVGPAPDQFIKR